MSTMPLDAFHDVIRETLEEVPLAAGCYLVGSYERAMTEKLGPRVGSVTIT